MNANTATAGGAVDPRPRQAQIADLRQPTQERRSIVELLDACGHGYTAAERDHILATMREELAP